LARAPDDAVRTALLDAVQMAYEGVSRPALPARLAEAFDAHTRRLDAHPLVSRLRDGDAAALDEARAAILDASLATGARTAIIRQLGETAGESSVPALLRVLSLEQASAEKRVALQALARVSSPAVAEGILQRYGTTLPAEH